jgi:hypothetical protein
MSIRDHKDTSMFIRDHKDTPMSIRDHKHTPMSICDKQRLHTRESMNGEKHHPSRAEKIDVDCTCSAAGLQQ